MEVMLDIYMMEKLTFAARLESDKSENFWSDWVDFISPLRKDFIWYIKDPLGCLLPCSMV